MSTLSGTGSITGSGSIYRYDAILDDPLHCIGDPEAEPVVEPEPEHRFWMSVVLGACNNPKKERHVNGYFYYCGEFTEGEGVTWVPVWDPISYFEVALYEDVDGEDNPIWWLDINVEGTSYWQGIKTRSGNDIAGEYAWIDGYGNDCAGPATITIESEVVIPAP